MIEDQPILIPPGCVNLHQEVELGVVIGKLAKNVKSVDAFDYIGGYTVALDMTARDLQVILFIFFKSLFKYFVYNFYNYFV